ncbi:lytic transglycosylase domain-containing protein [Uliginosibacterium sp. H3]|uniref:Lytic transglycosylase domain-containing protein n=1 Tax=Uliginosibacterium silvisoli TaxID=3114758 RepID=A0ABU6K839_9RHOO|nr:lytic transglycosylase domain-containing protein [Uliginosibacterium sp. H3]
MTSPQTLARFSAKALLICVSLGLSGLALAGGQREEALAASVQASMQKAISDTASPEPIFASEDEKLRWLTEMSPRLVKRLPDTRDRVEFLKTVYYEAQRAGLDPQLVLGLIEVESAFRKYAVSSVGARGFMQVMPFWVKQIGTSEQNLFHLRTNLRYGCTILRHYLDIEKGDLYRALGRYNGSLGRPEYPNMVRAAWEKKWAYEKPKTQAAAPLTTTVAQR